MAKKLIPEELDELIKEFFTDGILTDRERGVILKKAESMGLDVDEVDLYLDAQVQKLEKAAETAKRESKGRTCPFCDGEIPELATKCPHCGKSITAKANSDLKEIFDNLENSLVKLKSGEDPDKSKALVERYVRKAKMYYDDNPKVQKLLSEIKEETAKAEKKVKSQARSKNITAFISHHKLLAAVVVLALVGIVVGIVNAVKGPDISDDAQATMAAMNSSIQEGDLSKAQSLYMAYSSKHGNANIEPSTKKLVKAFIDNGDYDAAESLKGQDLITIVDDINWMIQNEFIKVGEYDRAEACVNWWGSTDEHFSFLCKCIDQMKENGDSKDKIKSFIVRKTARYDSSLTHEEEWHQPAVKKRLYEYAGIE